MIDFLTSLLPRTLTPLQREAVRQVTNELDGDNAPAVPNRHGLVPVGDSGFYVTPNEPVDPWDCQAWPNSPFCDRSVASPITNDVEIGISGNECETCVTLQPTVLHIRGPAYTVCYRSEACRPAPPVPPSDTSQGGEPYDFPAPNAPPGYCRVVYARMELIRYPEPRFWNQFKGCYQDRGDSTRTYTPGMGPEGVFIDTDSGDIWTDPKLLVHRWASAQMSWEGEAAFPFCPAGGFVRPGGMPIIWTYFLWRDYGPDDPKPDPNGGLFEYQLIYDSCSPPGPVPPPAIDVYPGDDDMGCNCGEMEELLRAIYTRMGCDQFPIKVPSQLAGRTAETTDLPDFANVFAWWVYQMDSLVGEWPVEIEITDDNPLEEGDQRKRVSLPNIAETLAELFGFAYKNDTRGDIDTEILLRMVAELIATKNASLITQDYAKANASFLGYKGNPTRRKIDYAFNPTRLDSLTALMQESSQYITGWSDDDEENIVSYLQRLMFSAGIIKTVFMRNGDQAQDWLDSLRTLFGDAIDQDSDWERFVQRLRDPQDPINLGTIPRPDSRDFPSAGG